MEHVTVDVELNGKKLQVGWENALCLTYSYEQLSETQAALVISAQHRTEFRKTPVVMLVAEGTTVKVKYPPAADSRTQIFVNGALWLREEVWETNRSFGIDMDEFDRHPRVFILAESW